MPSILVCDADPIYRELTSGILTRGGYPFTLCRNREEAEIVTSGQNFDVVILDLALIKEDDGIFAVVRPDPATPLILTTEESLDPYFDRIVASGINQILGKPIKSDELLRVIDRILNPLPERWFGLENYITPDLYLKRIEINRSTQIRNAIRAVFDTLDQAGFPDDLRMEMDLVWQELITNAIYHSHGFSREKTERIPIELPAPYQVTLRFGGNENQFGISIRDMCGSLSPARILESLAQAISEQKLIEKAGGNTDAIMDQISTRGRGIDLVRRLGGEFYFVIDPGKSTEVVIIYDKDFHRDDPSSNLHILELPKHH